MTMENKTTLPFTSVIVPMYNEEKYIRNCLLSLVNQDFPQDKYEIIVIDGLSEDNSPQIVKELIKEYPNIRYMQNPERKTAKALNIGINESRGEIIVRMDSHGIAPSGYISTCVKYLVEGVAENIGGVINTVGEEFWGETIALAGSSPFGVGNSKFRYSKDEQGFDQAGWPGAFWKTKMQELKGFDETLGCNEDDDFNYRLMKAGNKVFWTSEIVVTYFSRNSLKVLWKQYFKYGFWKVKVIQKFGKLTSIRHLIPTMFVLGLTGLPILSFFHIGFLIMLFTGVGLYTLAALFFTLKICTKKGYKFFWSIPIAFAILHLSYGSGFLMGLFNFGLKSG